MKNLKIVLRYIYFIFLHIAFFVSLILGLLVMTISFFPLYWLYKKSLFKGNNLIVDSLDKFLTYIDNYETGNNTENKG